jgi:hypothetical protein
MSRVDRKYITEPSPVNSSFLRERYFQTARSHFAPDEQQQQQQQQQETTAPAPVAAPAAADISGIMQSLNELKQLISTSYGLQQTALPAAAAPAEPKKPRKTRVVTRPRRKSRVYYEEEDDEDSGGGGVSSSASALPAFEKKQ